MVRIVVFGEMVAIQADAFAGMPVDPFENLIIVIFADAVFDKGEDDPRQDPYPEGGPFFPKDRFFQPGLYRTVHASLLSGGKGRFF